MTVTGTRGNLDWLVAAFAERTGVAHAVVVSADGLTVAATPDLPEGRSDQLAAIVAGTVSLTRGVARHFDGGDVVQTIVDMDAGYLFMMSVGEGSHLAVLGPRGCDVGQVGYEMTVLVEQVGWALSAQPRSGPPAPDAMRGVARAG